MKYYIVNNTAGVLPKGNVLSTKHDVEWFEDVEKFKNRCEELNIDIEDLGLEQSDEVTDKERIEALEDAILEMNRDDQVLCHTDKTWKNYY